MTVIRQSTVIDARPEEVWAIISDPRNLPRWNSLIKAVHGAPPDGLKPGDRYSTEVGALGVRFKVAARVLETDPPRSAMVRLTGPLEATVRTWLRPVGKNRTRLEHEVDYRLKGGPIGTFIARGVKHIGAPAILKRGIKAQKRQVESG